MQIRENEKSKRISLETKNKILAQELYNAYLLDRVKSKLYKTNYVMQAHHQIQESTIAESKKLIKPIYQKYITHCELQNLSKATINGKLNLLSIFQKHKITYIEDLTQETFNKLIKSWENNKKDTLRKHIANIKAFLNYCIKQKSYSRDDYETLTFPNPKVGIRDLVINEQDYLKLINHCKDHDFTLYLDTLWETGCRPNEITQLKKSDIDFNKGIAKIYQFKTKKYKTAYLTDRLLELYRAKSDENIFNGHDRQKEYYAKKFSKLRDELKLNKEYCLYTFRHTFGTRMMNKTKDIHLVSKLLGHSDISITAKHYINRSDDDIRQKLLENN
ncbi:MAG: tyrosine-type recombinase/integrase [Brevinema sp.]